MRVNTHLLGICASYGLQVRSCNCWLQEHVLCTLDPHHTAACDKYIAWRNSSAQILTLEKQSSKSTPKFGTTTKKKQDIVFARPTKKKSPTSKKRETIEKRTVAPFFLGQEGSPGYFLREHARHNPGWLADPARPVFAYRGRGFEGRHLLSFEAGEVGWVSQP